MVIHTEKFLSRTATIEDLAIDINNCAVQHGWWKDPNRPLEMQRLLFASEVLEAFERFRKAPAESMHLEVAEELVDVLIRLLDAHAHNGRSTNGPDPVLNFIDATQDYFPEVALLDQDPQLIAVERWARDLVDGLDDEDLAKTASDAQTVQMLDDVLSGIYELEATDDDRFRSIVANAVICVALFCAIHDISLSTILLDKMRKNWDRPYRHGGLRA